MNTWNKLNDFQESFVNEMVDKQEERSSEVGGHTWRQQIDTYGLPIMFAELANIMSRLELMLWTGDANLSVAQNPLRLLDLLVDLGNYTAFTYEYVLDQAKEKHKPELISSDSESMAKLDNISVRET